MHEPPTFQSRKSQEKIQVGGPCSAHAAMPTCWRCPKVLQKHFLTGQNIHRKSDPWQMHREFWAHPVNNSSQQLFHLCMHKCAQSAPNSLHTCSINTNAPWTDLLDWLVLLFYGFLCLHLRCQILENTRKCRSGSSVGSGNMVGENIKIPLNFQTNWCYRT